MQTRSQTYNNNQRSLLWRWLEDSKEELKLIRTDSIIECKNCKQHYNKYVDYCNKCNIKLSNRSEFFKYL